MTPPWFAPFVALGWTTHAAKNKKDGKWRYHSDEPLTSLSFKCYEKKNACEWLRCRNADIASTLAVACAPPVSEQPLPSLVQTLPPNCSEIPAGFVPSELIEEIDEVWKVGMPCALK